MKHIASHPELQKLGARLPAFGVGLNRAATGIWHVPGRVYGLFPLLSGITTAPELGIAVEYPAHFRNGLAPRLLAADFRQMLLQPRRELRIVVLPVPADQFLLVGPSPPHPPARPRDRKA